MTSEKAKVITKEYPCPKDWLRFEAIHRKECWGWTAYSVHDVIQWVDDKGNYCVVNMASQGQDKVFIFTNPVPREKAKSIKKSFAHFQRWVRGRLKELKEEEK